MGPNIAAVAIGGAAGALARYATVLGAARWWGDGFPWGVLAANLMGSLAMGFLAALLGHLAIEWPALRLLILTGFLGGFTTFSSFSIDTFQMLERGAWGEALAYLAASVLGGVLLLWCGWRLAHKALS
ncbi:MAG: fluoride efflux transporter CrcB [Leptospirales bacterium]|nr:fluoride efflux transporter CrcB [Leptospirales bacterium]